MILLEGNSSRHMGGFACILREETKRDANSREIAEVGEGPEKPVGEFTKQIARNFAIIMAKKVEQ